MRFYSTQVSFKAAWLTAPDTLVFRTQKDRPPEIFLSKPKLLKHFLLAILEYFLRYIYLLCFFSSIYLRVEQNFFILHKANVSFFSSFQFSKKPTYPFFPPFQKLFPLCYSLLLEYCQWAPTLLQNLISRYWTIRWWLVYLLQSL